MIRISGIAREDNLTRPSANAHAITHSNTGNLLEIKKKKKKNYSYSIASTERLCHFLLFLLEFLQAEFCCPHFCFILGLDLCN